MTIDDVKYFFDLKKNRLSLIERAKELESQATSITSHLDDCAPCTVPRNRFDTYVERKELLEQRIQSLTLSVSSTFFYLNMDKLTRKQMKVLELRYFYNYKWKDIASILEISESHLFKIHRDIFD